MTQFPATIDLSGLSGADGFKISGETKFDEDGVSVRSAGDINGDGFDDVIVGADGADPHGDGSGASYVVFGKASGFGSNIDVSSLNGINGFKISGVAAGDQAGRSVASAGDINHDGFDDLIIGADDADPHGVVSGAAYVVFGHASGFTANLDLSGLNGTNGFKISGEAAGYRTGYAVASAGDINGDGFDDMVVGTESAGVSYVVFGKSSGFSANLDVSSLNGTNGFRILGESSYPGEGVSVASAGDVNGDGFADLIVGAYGSDRYGDLYGAGYVVFGKATGFPANFDLSALNGANGFKLDGDSIGYAVSSAGDINGDGFDDILVGAKRGGPSRDWSGATYVVFGRASGFPAKLDLSALTGANGFKISGAASGDMSGYSVSSAGDVNGDGFADLIVGAPEAGDSGAAYIVFGKASGFSADLELSSLDGTNGVKITGESGFVAAGTSVASAGDVNGDGLSDVIIGSPFAYSNGVSVGRGYVVFGRLPDAAVIRIGTAVSQHLVGGNFADVLTGGGGNDTFYGNGGNDLLTGGPGNDVFYGGTGVDAVSYANAAAGVHVSLLTGAAQNTVGAGMDALSSIEKLVGSSFADTLTAAAAGSTLNGGAGGDDLIGGPGSDILNGGGASDFADYALATAGVTVNLTLTGFQNTVGAGSDELVGIEKLVGSNFNDTLTGDGGPNVLYGQGGNDVVSAGAGDDIVYGGTGNDTLNGGPGVDTLTGQGGNDHFVFTAAADTAVSQPDVIADFVQGQDLIDLSAIDANTAVAGDQAFHLGSTPGHTGDVVIFYNAPFNRTVVTFYVNGDTAPDGRIWLTGDHHGLTAADFVL